MAAVKNSDPDCKRETKGRLARMANEVLNRDAPEREASGPDLGLRAANRLPDRTRRSVDTENVSVADPFRDQACGRTGAAADLKNAHPAPERQRVDDRPKSL